MCCGASRAVGLRPQTSYLLGEEDGEPARYMKVLDGTLVSGVSTGAQRYFRGDLVDQAVDDGKLEDAMTSRVATTTTTTKITKFRVTLPDGREVDFASFATARQYAIRNGGTTTIIQEDPSDG